MSNQRREKLKIVFEIDVEQDSELSQIGDSRLQRVFQSSGITDMQMLQLAIGVMKQLQKPMVFIEHGNRRSADEFVKFVEKRGRWGVATEADGLLFHTGSIPLQKQCFISIEEIYAGAAISWADWVGPFLAEDGFVQAWVVDVEYDYWQNAKDPLEYEAAGRSYAQLPKISNGLPPPLEQMEIDISNNPGRWSHQMGYVEAIGSTMWLGLPFWKFVGETCKNDLLTAEWVDVQTLDKGIVELAAAEQCFCDETTKEEQNSLRAILYGSKLNNNNCGRIPQKSMGSPISRPSSSEQ